VIGRSRTRRTKRTRRRRLLIHHGSPFASPHPTLTEVDVRMMQRAIGLAQQAAAAGEVPVGAVLYRGEEVIATGYNLREAHRDPVAHAEMIALSDAGRALGTWRLNDCTLAVTLEPCTMCAGAIVNARLGRLIYGAPDPKAGAVHSLYSITSDQRLNHRVDVIAGLMRRRCAQLLRDFFRQRRAARRRNRP
jgi:tRNA(adenine34) deaminase